MTLAWTNVDFSYGQEPVLANFSLSFPAEAGGITGIVGPSGCGKTTLLHLAAGLLRAQRGAVTHGFARPAVVFQDPRLLPWLTAVENAAFGLKMAGVEKKERLARAQTLLADVGLTLADMEKYPAALSGGMKQRVNVARALAIDPDLWLLDEPFTGLDEKLRGLLMERVRAQIDSHGAHAVLVSHHIPDIFRLCHTVLILGEKPCQVIGQQKIDTSFQDRDNAFVFDTSATFFKNFGPNYVGS